MLRDQSRKRTLILGAGAFARLLVMEIRARPHCPYQVVGMVADDKAEGGLYQGFPLLGPVRELHRIIVETQPELIIVALPRHSELLADQHLVEARVGGKIQIEEAGAAYEHLTGKLPIETLDPRGVIFTRDLQPPALSMALARFMSLAFALAGMVLLAPLMLLIALAVRLDSPGPALFIHERVGLGGKPFKLLKFRTMHPSTGKTSEWEQDNAHRITRLGRWLRRFRLDELPQFINVLRGEMNIVGPRPHPASNFGLFVLVSRNTPECGFQIPWYSLRSMVRPGITGWAQVRYRYANNLREEIEKLRFDLYYVKHYSLWLDLRILCETVAVVLLGHMDRERSAGREEVEAKEAA